MTYRVISKSIQFNNRKTLKSIIGKKFGKLFAIKYAFKTGNDHYYWCKCECGEYCIIRRTGLISDNTKSCGCLQREIVYKIGKNNKGKIRTEKHKQRLSKAHMGIQSGKTNPSFKHGDALKNNHTKLYDVWHSIEQRCRDFNARAYKWYGARGISRCKLWDDYINFKNWAFTSGYEEGLTIDRIDNNGDYEPDNCQWITRSENAKKGNK